MCRATWPAEGIEPAEHKSQRPQRGGVPRRSQRVAAGPWAGHVDREASGITRVTAVVIPTRVIPDASRSVPRAARATRSCNRHVVCSAYLCPSAVSAIRAWRRQFPRRVGTRHGNQGFRSDSAQPGGLSDGAFDVLFLQGQNDRPRNGSMWPQYRTPNHTTIAEAATSFAVRGASSPGPTAHGSSTEVKYSTLMPPSTMRKIFQ